MVKSVYNGMMCNNELGYCEDGPFKGWVMAKHPDGQWVSLFNVPEISQEGNLENSTAAPVQQTQSKIALLKDAVHSMSGDYCSYDDRNSALRKINAVIAQLSDGA